MLSRLAKRFFEVQHKPAPCRYPQTSGMHMQGDYRLCAQEPHALNAVVPLLNIRGRTCTDDRTNAAAMVFKLRHLLD